MLTGRFVRQQSILSGHCSLLNGKWPMADHYNLPCRPYVAGKEEHVKCKCAALLSSPHMTCDIRTMYYAFVLKCASTCIVTVKI